MSDSTHLTDWMFRALLFEAEAEQFRDAGIRLGADLRAAERQLLEEALQSFPLALRNEALRMGRLYAQIYCFENSVRDMVRSRLEEKHGVDWWEKGVPKKVRELADSRQKAAKENSWLEGDKADIITFVEFGQLAAVIIEDWDDFADLIPSQQWLNQRLGELEQARNFIAHNRLLLPSEFQRLEMYLADWNKQVGV
jgi:hypothetical protein